MSNKNLITFLDAAQRTIIGEKISETVDITTIKNPVIVNIIPQTDQTGRPMGGMSLQLIPAFFKEFQADKNEATYYNYNNTQITHINFDGGFDFRLEGQYEHLFRTISEPDNKPSPVSEPPKTGGSSNEPPVIKLFDDDDEGITNG
jgi:hypothetical protein